MKSRGLMASVMSEESKSPPKKKNKARGDRDRDDFIVKTDEKTAAKEEIKSEVALWWIIALFSPRSENSVIRL